MEDVTQGVKVLAPVSNVTVYVRYPPLPVTMLVAQPGLAKAAGAGVMEVKMTAENT